MLGNASFQVYSLLLLVLSIKYRTSFTNLGKVWRKENDIHMKLQNWLSFLGWCIKTIFERERLWLFFSRQSKNEIQSQIVQGQREPQWSLLWKMSFAFVVILKKKWKRILFHDNYHPGVTNPMQIIVWISVNKFSIG